MISLENASIDNHMFKASYGTTKYCSNFLRNTLCMNKDCLYLHSLADEGDIISRDTMNSNKEIFASQHVMAIELSQILTSKSIKDHIINVIGKRKTIFPNPSTVYEKDIVKKYIAEHNLKQDDAHLDNNSQTESSPKRKVMSILDLDKIYNKKDKSRFDFAVSNTENNVNYNIDIPEKISDFLTEKFKRSILFNKEKEEVSKYFFSLPSKGRDAEDRWFNLLTTLEMYSSFDEHMNIISQNDDTILVSKFNSA
jgi:CCR4-NOT transcription complex subunit 4